MWMIWETGTKSLREIGELFGGLDYAAVAATDSSNTILSRFDWCQKVEDHNVKCLDLNAIRPGQMRSAVRPRAQRPLSVSSMRVCNEKSRHL